MILYKSIRETKIVGKHCKWRGKTERKKECKCKNKYRKEKRKENIKGKSLISMQKVKTLKTVVYIDQQLGAVHSKHCLKYLF